jgi:hypothetical protein
MRRGRLLAGVIAGLTVCALGASAALAATPQQICQDLQDGRLDGHYSAADLAAFKADASVQGYCFLTVTPPSNAPSASAPSSGNAAPSSGQTSGGVAGAKASAPLATTKAKSGGLPFTGAQLTVALIIGGALLAGGLLLRVAARRGAG